MSCRAFREEDLPGVLARWEIWGALDEAPGRSDGGDRIVELRTTAGELVALVAVRERDSFVSDVHVRDALSFDALFTAAARVSPGSRLPVQAD